MNASSASRVYLDHNATAPLRPEARAAMLQALEAPGNASSVHAEGRRARGIIEAARSQVSELVGAKASKVIFTSGASEANNTVMCQPRWTAVAVSAVEHPSVIEPAKRLGADAFTQLPVQSDGQIDLDFLEKWLETPHEGDRLVAVQWANGETGTVQSIQEIADLVSQHGAFLHVDAVQAAGRIEIDAGELGAAFVTLSSHKIGGPQGVGAIVQGRGGELRWPLIVGGGQERRLRAGSENVAGCAGFGEAARCAAIEAGDQARIKALRDRLEAGVKSMTPRAVVVGEDGLRLSNTSSIAVAGGRAETSLIAFDLAGIAASAGSACSSGKMARSHVLAAIGMDEDLARSALRFSLGWSSTEDDVSRFLEAWGMVMNTTSAGVGTAIA